MPVNLTWEKQDAIPEVLKAHAVERDGKWVFDAELPDETNGLKSALQKEREANKKHADALKKLDRFKDVTDDAWTEFEEWKNRDPEGDPGKKPDASALEKAIAKEKARFERDLKAQKEASDEKDKKIATLEGRIRENEIWVPVKDLAVKNKVMGDRMDALVTLLKTQGRFDLDESGKLIFKDKEGYPTTVKPEKAFEVELKNEFPWAYEASGAGGSGAPNGTKAGGLGTAEFLKLSPTEQLKYAREHGSKT